MAGIPTVPRAVAGVMNHHGDALTVLAPEAVFEGEEAAAREPTHVLVLSAGPGGSQRLGLPVDRVLGLADGGATPDPGGGLVVGRCSLGGRVVALLDAQRLRERAAQAIARSCQAFEAAQGGMR